MKVLIVDDETIIATSIETKVKDAFPDWQVEKICSPTEALSYIKDWRPDILLLDIQMPELTGFELLDQLGKDDKTFALIFSTAYDQFAIKAFEEEAIDYLLKPIDPKRLIKALERAVLRVGHQALSFRPSQEGLTKIVVKLRNNQVILPIESICLFTSDSHTTLVFDQSGKEYVYDLPLGELEERLDGRFIRTHRSFVINKEHIESFDLKENLITIKHYSPKVPLAKRRKQMFIQAINAL